MKLKSLGALIGILCYFVVGVASAYSLGNIKTLSNSVQLTSEEKTGQEP